MNVAQLLEFHKKMTERMHAIVTAKNHDYAGRSGDTPFANFQRVADLGIASVEAGFLVRMTDKMSRLSTAFSGDGSLRVKDENVEDTLLDLANYAILLAAFIQQKERPDAPTTGVSGWKS
jgi:hypothetical protein